MDNEKTLSLKQRTAAIIAAGALAASTMFAPMAFANPVSPSATGPDNGDGITDLYVQIQNPDEAVASNFNVKVPTQINFVATAGGDLIGPNNATAGAAESYQSGSMKLDNDSLYAVYASHLKAASEGDWNIVSDPTTADTTRNAVNVKIGTTADKKTIYEAQTGDKGIALTDASWNMSGNGASNNADQVTLYTADGKINNVDASIASATKFATLTWYITPGVRAAQAQG